MIKIKTQRNKMKTLKIAGSIIGILLIIGVFKRDCTVKREMTINKPWGTLFGLFTEKYGIRYMHN